MRGSRAYRFLTNRARWLWAESCYRLWRVYDAALLLGLRLWPRRRRVLFVAMNELALRQLDRFLPVLGGDRRVLLRVSGSPRSHAQAARVREGCAKRKLRFIPFGCARLQPWDLIVFADHDDMSRFPVCVPKIRIPHGIGRGKLVDGVPYGYAPSWVNYRGRPFYTRMFEASEEDVAFAETCNPSLRGIVVVVGHLVADHLLSLRCERERIRSEMGCRPGVRTVLVQSTHGPTSLMETMGRQFVDACVQLAARGGWQFILQTHPHHWHGPRAESQPYGRLLLEQEGKPGIRVLRPHEDWARAMVASDMVVSDHTSILLLYALLGKPILFAAAPDVQLIEGNPLWRLTRTVPRLEGVDGLESALSDAIVSFPREQVAKIASTIVSCPGQAATRMRSEILCLLKLPETG